MTTFTVSTDHTYREGWGVSVMPIWEGDDEPEQISDIEVGVTRIAADSVQIISAVPCVVFDTDTAGESDTPVWVPVENYRGELPDVESDSHDLRGHWFASESEAREHAESVLSQWRNPNPWQSFVVLS